MTYLSSRLRLAHYQHNPDFADITETLNFSELMHRTRGGVDQPSPVTRAGI